MTCCCIAAAFATGMAGERIRTELISFGICDGVVKDCGLVSTVAVAAVGGAVAGVAGVDCCCCCCCCAFGLASLARNAASAAFFLRLASSLFEAAEAGVAAAVVVAAAAIVLPAFCCCASCCCCLIRFFSAINSANGLTSNPGSVDVLAMIATVLPLPPVLLFDAVAFDSSVEVGGVCAPVLLPCDGLPRRARPRPDFCDCMALLGR